jgi:hypothetical protein
MLPKAIKCKESLTNIPFIVKGQGVLLFDYTGPEPCIFEINDIENNPLLRVEYTLNSINIIIVRTDYPLIDKKCTSGLTLKKGATYWFSIDSQNQRIQAGIGEARLETRTYNYTFANDTKESLDANKAFLESLISVTLHRSIQPLYILRDPITSNVPLTVKNTTDLTMMDVATQSVMPKSNLSLVAQKLYDCVAGPKFVLDTPDFPDFSKAIEYSIATPGLWCNKRLQEKANEFSKEKPNVNETYLRITLGENNGESPGIPYVMEIWPIGHFSPIHNHGGSNAVIRVLHGNINVSLFPFLCTDKDGVKPFGIADFKKDSIVWISPTLNQVHQLKNIQTNTETCITIQCYMYENEDTTHYDYFDYLDENGAKQKYEPDSDMDFIKFKALMKQEWDARPKKTKFLCFTA